MATTRMNRREARDRLGSYRRRLGQVPTDLGAAHLAADLAIDHGLEAEALPAVSRACRRVATDGRLWQMLGLLHRGVDQHDDAISAFSKAGALLPTDGRIAHGLAISSLEAGVPSAELFSRALRLNPDDKDIWLGYVASLKADGRPGEAVDRLAEMLRRSPLWVEGHQSFARINAALGTGDELAAIEDAVTAHPQAVDLQVLRLEVLARLVTPAERLRHAEHVRARLGDVLPLIVQEAIAASEAGRLDRAEALFLAVGKHDNATLGLAILRHLIRAERFVDADKLAARLAGTSEAISAWAYRHTAWRALHDPRLEWLDRGSAFIRSYDVSIRLPPLENLAAKLREIHGDLRQPLDQSVLGGTQTDGPLFTRVDPMIRAVRRVACDAIEDYTSRLPTFEASHPLLSAAREEPVRFAGSWSVRLLGASGGQHANHIHGMGWLSSALYLALPTNISDDQGCLTFGAPPDVLGLDMAPMSILPPIAGKLVLFPSYLWHGVTPFEEGERLTIAFDVARPPT